MFSKHLDEKNNYWGKPYGTRLKEEQHSLPAGTKIINLEIPFHIGLLMAKEDGKMKVICVFSRVLPD